MSYTRFSSRPRSSTTGEGNTFGWTDEGSDDPFQFLGCCNCYRDLASNGKRSSRVKKNSTTFWLLECGHLSCAICLGYEAGQPNPHQDHQCPMPTCNSSHSAIHEVKATEPIHSSIGSYLLPHRALTDQLASSWAFQFEHMSLRIQNLRKRVESQRTALENSVIQLQALRSLRGELAELKVVNHQLRLELEHARAAPSVLQRPPFLNETSTTVRGARPEESYSRQPQNPTNQKRREPAYQTTSIDPGWRPTAARRAAYFEKCAGQYTFNGSRPPSRNTDHSATPKNNLREPVSNRFKPPSLGVIRESVAEDVRPVERAGSLAPGSHHQARPQEDRHTLEAPSPRAPGGYSNQLKRPTAPQEMISQRRQNAIVPLPIPPRSTASRNVSHPQHFPNAPPNHQHSNASQAYLPPTPRSRASDRPTFTYHPEPNEPSWNQNMAEAPISHLPPLTPSRYAHVRGEPRDGQAPLPTHTRSSHGFAAQSTSGNSTVHNGLYVPRFGVARGAQ
ncbi:hypothetical protein CROQUDRAFT_686170 [Cronartium quercuum f. sp. fusiforme G11]|uniref:Uncharacterized protein n=1 Tax=Cronartium quercuum f. sp. fusiforme G11 TaxID=708437 RepID=A0A9P6NBJ4_9BASI|nr:hypothetical protein CROQUDRAFT_686170 [Cronartium quercuum f. sp. fusiforme G11]